MKVPTALLHLLAALLCSTGQHCQPFFIHPASDVLSCNPYQKQCPLEFVCKVSGLMDPGYTLSWTSTNKNKTDKASVHKYEKIGGCYHLTSTLKLLEPMVSQGVYWCVVFAADGTQFLQSSPFSLLAPDHYSNLPACGCPTNESKTSYRDSKEHARKEIREVGMSEMSGSGQASTTEISITGTIVPLVVGSGSIMIFVICLLLAIVCIYCSYKKHRVHAMTELDSATVTDSDCSEESVNYISYSDIEAPVASPRSEAEAQSQPSEDSELGDYQSLNRTTLDYLTLYTHLGRDGRIEEGDSLPQTTANSFQRRLRFFLGRRPKSQVTDQPHAAVRNPSAHRIRHSDPLKSSRYKKIDTISTEQPQMDDQ